MLPKKYRLPKEKFQTLYKKGVKIRGKYGMLIAQKDEKLSNPLLGIVASKKIGNAVQRHRMTRLVRNIYLDILEKNSTFKNSPTLLEYISFEYCDSYATLSNELSEQIEKALA